MAWRLDRYLAQQQAEADVEHDKNQINEPSLKFRRNYNVDRKALEVIFNEFDTDKTGNISIEELEVLLVKLGVAPLSDVTKVSSASSDRKSSAVDSSK